MVCSSFAARYSDSIGLRMGTRPDLARRPPPGSEIRSAADGGAVEPRERVDPRNLAEAVRNHEEVGDGLGGAARRLTTTRRGTRLPIPGPRW